MRQFLVLILLLALNITAAPLLRGESSDPSELFLNAYMSVQKGQKLEEDGKYKLALQKYRYAASLLEQIHEKSPEWQPLIVGYRLNKTTESIATIEKKISVDGNGPMTEDVEPPLPQKSDENAPGEGAPAAPTVTTPGGNGADPFEEMRAKYEEMQSQLKDVKEKYAEVQREKEDLADKLDEAVKQREQARTDAAQLKSQLVQAEDAYKNAVADKTADTEGQKKDKDEIARLQNALKDVEAERDTADDAKDEATKKLKSQLAQAQDAYKNAVADTTRNAVAQKKDQDEIARLQKELKDTQAERDVANDANDDASQKLASLRTERNLAVKQRDEAMDSLKKAKEGQQQVDKLMADNAALMQKLGDAEKTIAHFNENAPAKDKEIAALKKDVSDAREQLAAALKQSQENLNSMNDLQAQLETATTELAEVKSGTASPDDRKKLSDENDLLRGIVIRERKEEAHRDQEKKLALEELGKLNIQSDTLVEKLNYLAQPVLKLTDQERALFKQPDIDINDNNIAIYASKPQVPPAATPASAPSSQAPSPAPASQASPPAPASAPSSSPSPAVAAAQPSPSGTPGASASPAPAEKTANAAGPRVQTEFTAPVSSELLPQAKDAKDQFERGKYREAEQIYRSMLGVEPANIYLLSNLGVVLFRSGKLKPAEQIFQKAIAVSPNDEFSHRTLGIVYYTEGKFDDAVSELTKSLVINPKDAVGHNYLGITASAKTWQEAARKELETAVAIDPNYSDAHFNLAVIYLTTPPIDKVSAKKHYEKAVELGSEPDPALEQLLNKP